MVKTKNLQPRPLYPARLLFKIKKKRNKELPRKKKLKEFITTESVLEEMLKEILEENRRRSRRSRRKRKGI